MTVQVKNVDFVGTAVSNMDAAREYYGGGLGLIPERDPGFGEQWWSTGQGRRRSH